MAEERVTRKLAAILAADMVGYSRLMEKDEEGTIARHKAHRAELIDPKFAAHGGRIVKTTGDGLLVEFASAVDAVRCATEIQRAMTEREADVPDNRRIAYRVGINIGDIVIDGDDILGDGVNVAARIEGLAEPGGICLSDDAYRHVRDKFDLAVDDMGEQRVKNIERPVRAYRVQLEGSVPRSEAVQASPPLPDKPSFVVLPFENLSGDPEQEYFADGITEDMITALSRSGDLFVIARNSSFTYKGKPINLKQVAAELGVRYALEGSVRKAGNRVRITAQLIDAPDDRHIWAERYDRELDDVFAVQDEIVERIAGSLESEIFRAELLRARNKGPGDIAVWDLESRARWHFYKMTRDDHAEARGLCEQAIELDPNRAQGSWAMLGMVHVVGVILGFSDDPEGSISAAVEAAERSIALDDRTWLGHVSLGISLIWARQYDRGLMELERSIELNPNSAIAHFNLANGATYAGRKAEAMEHHRIGMRLSPRDPLMDLWLSNQALSCLIVRELDQAVALARKAAQLNPSNIRAHIRLACALGHLGREKEAHAAFADALASRPEIDAAYIEASHPFRDPDDRNYLLDGLHKAGLPQ